MSIQDQINAAQPGQTVIVPATDTVQVDAVNAPIRLKSGVTLQIDGTLQVITNNSRDYRVVLLENVSDATVILNGEIIGDKGSHTGNPGDDHGFGVVFFGAVNCTLRGNGSIRLCMGDGVYVSGASKKIRLLDKFVSTNNNRQGLSVIDVDGLEIDGPGFCNSGDAPPSGGIDFEPDDPTKQSIRNVTMRNAMAIGNKGASVLIACPPSARSNISIDGSNKLDNHPIDGTDGVVPFWAKWFYYAFKSYALYPRSITL